MIKAISPNLHIEVMCFFHFWPIVLRFYVIIYPQYESADGNTEFPGEKVNFILLFFFSSKVISFFQHFNQLQVVLGRMRAYEDGRRLTSAGQCASRIDLGKISSFTFHYGTE